MKKKLIFILLAILAMMFVFSACGGNDEPTDTSTDSASDTGTACVHDWKFTSGTVTCIAGGDATYTCSLCQATKSETGVVALGHDPQFVSTLKPTCVAGGYDSYKCSRCDYTEKRNETPKSIKPEAHSYKEIRVEPTCTDTGSSEVVCELCGAGDGEKEMLSALGHTYERTYAEGETDTTIVTTVPRDCENHGKITKQCADCDAVIELTYESLTGESATAEDLALAETLKALGHDYTKESQTVNATCTDAGYKINACANEGCTSTMQVANYPKLGHTYERAGATNFKYKTVVEPLCFKAGKEWAVCEDCAYNSSKDVPQNAAYSREIPATGDHDFSYVVRVVGASCIKQGYTEYKCTTEGCGATTEINAIGPLPEHKWTRDTDQLTNVDGEWVATCKTGGNYPYYCATKGCSATGINKQGEEYKTLRHEGYTKGEYVAEPTCIKNAMYLCNDCGTEFEAYSDDNAALATNVHDFSKIENAVTVAPTCESYGYIEYHCSADADCTAMECREIKARAPHTFDEISSDGIAICTVCKDQFINIKTEIVNEFKDGKDVIVSSEGTRLCEEDCQGCAIHDIIVKIQASTSPGDPTAIELVGENYSTEINVSKSKPINLIQLNGTMGTTYTIELLDKDGNKITSFKEIINGKEEDINIEFATEKDAVGTMFVDIAEVASEVVTIKITASGEGASVDYYTTYVAAE